MNRDSHQLRLDLFAVRYLEAAEHGDLSTISDLWARASQDPELEAIFHGLNAELAKTPVVRRRTIWIGLATGAAAACVAALIWLAILKQGTQKLPVADPPRPEVTHHQLPPNPSRSPAMALVPRNRLLGGDQDSVNMPAFAWPFSEKPMIKGSSPIPADLLN